MGSDVSDIGDRADTVNFNPRSPHGERLYQISETELTQLISIHAPRMGSDLHGGLEVFKLKLISIHAPRMGSDSIRLK